MKESGAENVMPGFASYGVNRAVLNVPVRIRTKHEFGRIEAYQNAVSGTKTDFKTFFEWFRNQEDIENAEKVERGDLNYEDPAKIFPYIQFIITTHSPQVLGELPPEFMLLRLEPDANGAIQAEEMARGFFDSNFVLEDYMRTPSVDGCVRECEEELFHAIEERRFDEAEKLVGELSKLTNASDPNITRAQILLHRRKR